MFLIILDIKSWNWKCVMIQLLPGYDDTHEDVAHKTHDAEGDVCDGEGPQHVVLHPKQYTLQYSKIQTTYSILHFR